MAANITMLNTSQMIDVDRELLLRLPRVLDEDVWNELRQIRDIADCGLLPELEKEIDDWRKQNYGLCIIEHIATESIIGVAGLAEPYRNDGPHLICAVHPEWRCKGRALRACKVVLAWADEAGYVVYGHVEKENKVGLLLVESLGGQVVSPKQDYFSNTGIKDYQLNGFRS